MTAPAKRRIALIPAPLTAPAAATLPPAMGLRNSPLPSQKTWTTMMERLEAKYGQRKRKVKKKKTNPKKKAPSRKARQAFRAKLRGMVKRGKSVLLETSLRQLMQAFPQAEHGLKVYPKRSSLYSTVGRVPGSKRKLNTFL